MRAAPSPTPPGAHSNRHQSNSEDDNAFEDKEEVFKSDKIIIILKVFYSEIY